MQLDNQCAGGCPIGSIANEMADFDEEARSILVDSFDRWEKAFEQGIVAMRTEGLLRAEIEPNIVAAAILSSVQGGLLLCKTQKDTAPLEASLDAAIAYLRSFAAGRA
nr:TetR family transcriptional regulator C-terminal domain-containing protein [Diaminobutyricibacter tongyongensis]